MARTLRRFVYWRTRRLRTPGPRRDREAAEVRLTFLLDTDTCIYALKQDRSVLEQLLSTSRVEVAVSVITEAELRTGAAKSSAPVKTLRLIENFLRPLAI